MSTENPNVKFTTAVNMFLDHGLFSDKYTSEPQKSILKSGLPFSIIEISGRNRHEGAALAAIAGNLEDFPDQEKFPNGPLIRMHSACIFSEAGDNKILLDWLEKGARDHMEIAAIMKQHEKSTECDCRAQRIESQRLIAEKGGIYFDLIDQEGRGAGLEKKREAYRMRRKKNLDTFDAYKKMHIPFDSRDYGHIAQFLIDNKIYNVQLLSNNPEKAVSLEKAGIKVTMVPLVVGVTPDNIDYLKTKRDKAGHKIGNDQELEKIMNTHS